MNLRLTLGCLLAISAGVQAQAPARSDSVSRELAAALLGGSMGGRNIDIRPMLADDSLPATLFRDALLLGYSDLGYSVLTVAYFPYTPLTTMDTIKARLIASGWKAPPVPAAEERGFVSSLGPRSMNEALCSGSSVVFPTVSQRTINRTLAVISRQHSRGAAESYCGDRSALARMRNPAQDTPLPALTPPPGMSSRGGGTSGSPDDPDRAMSMETSLEGNLPVTDINTHYERLFTAAGWKRVDVATTGSLSAAAYEITDSSAVRWHCGFVVSMPRAGAANVVLFLRRL